MTTAIADTLTIGDLPWLVSALLHRTEHPVLDGGDSLEIRPRYLRNKLERGLVMTFATASPGLPRRSSERHQERLGTLTLAAGLVDRRLPFSRSEVLGADLCMDERGVLWADSLGVRVQFFPADPDMPALGRCVRPQEDPAVRAALERAGRLQLHDASIELVSASAEAVRYKPGNRCTLRYRLMLRDSSRRTRELTVFGKVYADLEDAELVYRTMDRLHRTTAVSGSRAVVPAPLARDAALGFVVFEAVKVNQGPSPLRPAAPQDECAAHLRKAAETLARLHASASEPAAAEASGSREAKRAGARAGLLAASCTEHAARLQSLAELVTRRLEAAPPALRPVHGAMKPSHVVYSNGAAVLIDCDSTRMDDPAMDVGGFLAYLRPGGIWFRRPGSETWFESAARCFRDAYRDSMSRLGIRREEIESCLERSRAYECSRLLKIAARRPQRLNCVLAAELGAMCDAMERLVREQP